MKKTKTGYAWNTSQKVYGLFKTIIEAGNDNVYFRELVEGRDKSTISKQLTDIKTLELIEIKKVGGEGIVTANLNAFNTKDKLTELFPYLAKMNIEDRKMVLIGAISFNHAEAVATVLEHDKITTEEKDCFLKIFARSGSAYSAFEWIREYL